MFDHSRLGLENKFFPNKITQSPTTLNFMRLIHSLSNNSAGETMDNWTVPKYNFMKHTIVLGGSQFTRCIPLSIKRKAKKKSGRMFCVRQVYFTSKSWRKIQWRVNQPFTSEVNSTMRRYFFFYHADLGQNLFFFSLFKPIILQFSQFCNPNNIHEKITQF